MKERSRMAKKETMSRGDTSFVAAVHASPIREVASGGE